MSDQTLETCSTCNGTGLVSPSQECTVCSGSGKVPVNQSGSEQTMVAPPTPAPVKTTPEESPAPEAPDPQIATASLVSAPVDPASGGDSSENPVNQSNEEQLNATPSPNPDPSQSTTDTTEPTGPTAKPSA